MMFWKCCIFSFIISTADCFEINILHKPKVHKSFGQGSYVFNQPVYEHGYEGMRTMYYEVKSVLDGRESVGHGFYQSLGDNKPEKSSSYNDPDWEKFLEFLRREYELQRADILAAVGGKGPYTSF